MNENLRKMGHPSQGTSVRRIMLRDGRAEGMRVIEIMTEGGLYLTVLEDNALNLYDACWKGMNLCFKTKVGPTANRYLAANADGFNDYWYGGLLYTCGLASTGTDNVDNGVFYPAHGRIGMMPAENVSVSETETDIRIAGDIYDRKFCGYNLCLHRTITVGKQQPVIRISDTMENFEALPAEYMMIYHFNLGYPLLDDGCRLRFSEGEIIRSVGNEAASCSITGPKDKKEEELFWRKLQPAEDGFASGQVWNPEKQLGVRISYRTAEIPYLLQWKNLVSHDYALGMEPTVSMSLGRAGERANGTLPVLPGYGKKDFSVKLEVITEE